MQSEPITPGDTLPRGVRLGVDLGDVRIGLATSDPDGLLATPVETVPRDRAAGTPDQATDLARIVDIVGSRVQQSCTSGCPVTSRGAKGRHRRRFAPILMPWRKRSPRFRCGSWTSG